MRRTVSPPPPPGLRPPPPDDHGAMQSMLDWKSQSFPKHHFLWLMEQNASAHLDGFPVVGGEALHHAMDAANVVVGRADEGEEALQRVLPQHPCAPQVGLQLVVLCKAGIQQWH